MKTLSIHEQEDTLFKEWVEYYYNLFCWDGLHRTGTPIKGDDGCWTMKPDNKEEELWWSSPIRCLFLTKDHNHQGDYEGVDSRCETGYTNKENCEEKVVYRYFYEKYLMLLYGIMHIDRTDFRVPDIEEAKDEENYMPFFHQTPVARINTKKLAGAASCPKELLAGFLANDYDYIRRQIGIYDANIIICCDGTDWNIDKNNEKPIEERPVDHILDVVLKTYTDLRKENDWIYYSEKEKVIVLHEYHMSNRVSKENYYEGAQSVADFLKNNPCYLRNNKL